MKRQIKNTTKAGDLLPVYNLIGTPLENFYNLGIKDRPHYQANLSQMKALIRTPWKKVDLLVEKTLKLYIKKAIKKHPSFEEHVGAYARGLKAPVEEIALAFLLPELMSSIQKWLPGVPSSLFGCSSYFTLGTEGPVHLRILDFPLMGTFDLYERGVLFKSKGYPSIFSYSSAGLPYPSLTAVTSEGVTLGLHQKFTPVFNLDGMPIFEMVWQLLNNAHDLPSAMAFLKNCKSITTWSLYMCFKDGQMLEVDIAGDELHFEKRKLKEGKIFYVNNMLVGDQSRQKDYLPYSIQDYCQMRQDIAHKKIQKLEGTKAIEEDLLIKRLCTPLAQSSQSAVDWKLDPCAPSSISITTMNPLTGKCLYIPSAAPKFYRGDLLEITNCFSKPKVVLHQEESPTSEDYYHGAQEMALALAAFDRKDMHQAYHHIQMSVSYFANFPERFVAQFYFQVLQFMEETHKEIQGILLEQFKTSSTQLPRYLKDHALLFVFRLEKILGKEITVKAQDIDNPKLKNIFQFEKKIPAMLLYKAIAPLMNPRMDILDIVYGHVR